MEKLISVSLSSSPSHAPVTQKESQF